MLSLTKSRFVIIIQSNKNIISGIVYISTIIESRAGKTGHRVVFVSCQFRVVSNLGRPKLDPFNNRVKILRPKPDTEK